MIKHFCTLFLYNILIIVVRSRHHVHTPNLDGGPKIEPRIVGGNIVMSREAYPYQVSIQTFHIHICGGAIVGKHWVLTAAHCVMRKPFDILAGTNNLDDYSTAKYYTPQEIIVHCNYDYPEFSNDIALIRTEETISLSKEVKAIPLGIRFPLRNSKLLITGWGAVKNIEDLKYFPKLLQWLEFKAVSYESCFKSWIESGGIDVGNVCAYNSIGKGACSGDSGSPLVYNGVLVGIANYVLACALGIPDVFASVPFHLDFIRTTMRTCDKEFPQEYISRTRIKSTKRHHGRYRKKYHRTSIHKRKDLEIPTHHAWRPKSKINMRRRHIKDTWGQRIHVH